MPSLSSLFPVSAIDPSNEGHMDALNQFLHASKRTAKDYEALKEALMPYEPHLIIDATGLPIEVLGKRKGREFGLGTPFQFFDAGEKQGDRKVLISLHSHLARSINAGDKITISGLGEAFEVKRGDYIYLDVSIDTFEPKSATVVHGDSWRGYPEAIHYAGTDPNRVQIGCRVELGFVVGADENFEFYPPGLIVGSGKDALMVIQNVHTHLIMLRTCDDVGRTVLFPFPWWGLHIPSWSVAGATGSSGGLTSGGLTSGGLTSGGL